MNKPKQYIQGWTEFYKLRFEVTPDVLIPRPETELLVDAVLSFVSSLSPKSESSQASLITYPLQPITILDLGTGSGNIAISLAKNLLSHLEGAKLNIIASDLSTKALKVARQNAKLHGVEDRIDFVESNLLSSIPFPLPPSPFPLVIVTNLPYIPTDRINYLDSSVKDFEPFMALDGGQDGFQLYRQLFTQINQKGLKPSLIIGEIDYTHAEIALQEAQKYFPKAEVEVKKDLTHLQRILSIRVPGVKT